MADQGRDRRRVNDVLSEAAQNEVLKPGAPCITITIKSTPRSRAAWAYDLLKRPDTAPQWLIG
jgi:hypothetical protein